MTPEIQKWVKINRPTYIGNVLEIGSLNVNGGVRELFADAVSYTGIDLVNGVGVDMVMSGHNAQYYYHPHCFDTIICLETIEHDASFWLTMDSIATLLKVGGHLILSSPSYGFPYHHPPDYYRFSREAIEHLATMNDRRLIRVDTLLDPNGNPCTIAISQSF